MCFGVILASTGVDCLTTPYDSPALNVSRKDAKTQRKTDTGSDSSVVVGCAVKEVNRFTAPDANPGSRKDAKTQRMEDISSDR